MLESIYQAENPEFKDFPLVSPVYTATQYAKNKNIFSRMTDAVREKITGQLATEGGYTCDAVNLLLEQGYCEQSEVDPKNNLYEKIMYLKGQADHLKNLKSKDKEMSKAQGGSINRDLEYLRADIGRIRNILKESTPKYLCDDKIGIKIFKSFGEDLKNVLTYELDFFDKVEQKYYSYINDYCGKNLKQFKTKKYSCVDKYFLDTADLNDLKQKNQNYLNEILNKQFVNPPVFPIELGICSGVLNKGPEKQYLQPGFGIEPKKDCGPHAINLVGRRWNSAKCSCQLLLKNSWDGLCFYPSEAEVKAHPNYPTFQDMWMSYAKQGWECDKTKKGSEKDLFWADQDSIMKNTLNFSHISKEK